VSTGEPINTSISLLRKVASPAWIVHRAEASLAQPCLSSGAVHDPGRASFFVLLRKRREFVAQ